MLPEDQKRILGYFIEEAKDHLTTIEQGLLNLAATVDDPEMMNEVFRAAHSVKGGAAMLGLHSIQRTSHRMEDFFKVMKESRVHPDRDLESGLLQIFDGLQEQLEQLQSPFGLTDDQAQEIMAHLEPVFVQAESHLNSLVAATPVPSPVVPEPVAVRPSATEPVQHPETSALQLVFRSDIPALLRDMLATFKQPDDSASRKELGRLCQRLHSLGEQFELSQWCALTNLVDQAIANPQQTYRTLAPVVIKDLKQAQDQVLTGAHGQVAASQTLRELLPVARIEAELGQASDDSTLDALLAEALSSDTEDQDLADLFAAAEEGDADDFALVEADNWFDQLEVDEADNVTDTGLESVFAQLDEPLTDDQSGPQEYGGVGPAVGAAELNSLADLFESAPASLADMWEDEELPETSLADLGLDGDQLTDHLNAEFADLLVDEADTEEASQDGMDDLASLFGYDLDAGGAPPSADAEADYLELEAVAAAPPIVAEADPLDAFLAASVASHGSIPEAADQPLDAFFDLDRPAGSDALSASLGNELEHFFDPLDDGEPVDDDDAHTMPEFNLDVDLLEGDAEALQNDPFGDLPLGASIFDLPLTDAAAAASSLPTPIAYPSQDEAPTEAETVADFTELESRMEPAAVDTAVAGSSAEVLSQEDVALEATPERPNDDRSDTAETPRIEAQELEPNRFDDLDALLEEDLPSSSLADINLAEVDPVASAVSDFSLDSGDDEFDDLEKLLEEADQLGGSTPTLSSRRAALPSARRSPRRASSTTDQTMRVSVGHLDTLSNLVGELVVNRNSLEQDQERLRQFLDNLLHQVSQLNDVGQRMRDLYERSLLESSLIANRQAFALGVSSSDRSGSSHATGATFDALEMDRFTGFHTLSQEMIELIVRVREASSDIEFTIDSTDQIARQFRQVTTQLQEGLNKARMVPFGQTADRLPRAVRDISIQCGKEAKLLVEGRDTLIDKMILERLYDPMTHLVNNAITHGIESPEDRLATGKPREGTITVRAFYQGNQTVIYIADNGGGINPAVVKAKALKQGLITPAEAQTMTEIEIYDLLFLPGFSTRDQADNFSGRGVGMDVVRTALADIRGSITIESEVGKGTSFTIRLPLTLSITKALSCVNNQARIAFPMDGVEDMFDVPKERIQTDDQGHSCILWRDTLLPFRPLGELLRFNRSLGRGRVYGGPQDEGVVSIVVLRSASTFIALQVDQVIGEQEIVIKQLEGPVPKPMGIAGATVLGDGRVMPIADVLELIDLASGRVRRDASTSLWTQGAVEEPVEVAVPNDPTVLIVDDSITVRELLSMSFNKVGYRVEQARDGQEAWEKLRSGLPCDLVFCDIEMPRMDGLELLSRIQKDSNLNQIPIAMLTSRGADRHRQVAVDLGAKGYFTKPYLEEMLLDAAQRMLKGENMMPRQAAE